MLKICFDKKKIPFYPDKILIKKKKKCKSVQVQERKNQPHTLPFKWVGCDGGCHSGNSKKEQLP